MGEIFREEITKETNIGKEIEQFLNKGVTVPIEVAINAIKNTIISAPTNNVIIDGYPRDKEQLVEFNNFINNQTEINLLGLIEIKVSENNARKRIMGRKGRDDDNLKIFADRMIYYKKYRSIIVDTYKAQNKYFEINGNQNFYESILSLKNMITNLLTL